MRRGRSALLMMLAPALLSACAPWTGPVPRPSGEGLCDGLRPLVDAHNAALVEFGAPDPVVITGEALISGFDGGCAGRD